MRIPTELPGSIRRLPALANAVADARSIPLEGKGLDAGVAPKVPTMRKAAFEKVRVRTRGTELSPEIQ